MARVWARAAVRSSDLSGQFLRLKSDMPRPPSGGRGFLVRVVAWTILVRQGRFAFRASLRGDRQNDSDLGRSRHIMSTAIATESQALLERPQPATRTAIASDAGAQSAVVPKLSMALRVQIVATLVGGTLLLCSLAAGWLWKQPFFAALPAAASVVLLAAPLVAAALKDLLGGKAGMNALVALAVIGAVASGKYQEAAAVAFFMIVSSLIEKRTAAGAEASIESLIRLAPTKASRIQGDGEELVEATSLSPGDVVRVRPGDTVPADGVVARGASTVNQASVTGESIPAEKADGDEVFGGTINLTGVLDVQVTKAGADTLLGRVKDLILEAERTRTPIMRLVDQYAAWYTPTILMLVGVVLFFALKSDPDTAFNRAIAMLVIACPSALILATPTAMVAALSAAARLGVLREKCGHPRGGAEPDGDRLRQDRHGDQRRAHRHAAGPVEGC
jgi:cation transport ATPase